MACLRGVSGFDDIAWGRSSWFRLWLCGSGSFCCVQEMDMPFFWLEGVFVLLSIQDKAWLLFFYPGICGWLVLLLALVRVDCFLVVVMFFLLSFEKAN